MNTSKVFESETLIRFSDCDPFNHLNNSRYIDYFINAREDQLAERGFNLYQLALEKGLGWVVSVNQIAYLKPAFLNERVIIESTLLQMAEKQVWVEMRMWDKSKTILKSLMWSQFIHFNLKTQRTEMHSAELMDFFRPFENPLEANVSFEERAAWMKNLKASDIR